MSNQEFTIARWLTAEAFSNLEFLFLVCCHLELIVLPELCHQLMVSEL
jgi:hypothetical protein